LSTGSYYKIIDISEGGVFVASKEPMEIGTDLQFDLQIEGFPENLSMVGVVIRHGDRDQHPGFAIEFMRVNPAYKRMLQTFINEELSKK
jgi:Tfp pilus assembly protein PilZ